MSMLPVWTTHFHDKIGAIELVVVVTVLAIGMPVMAAVAGDAVGAPVRQSGWWKFVATSDSGRVMGTQYLCVGPRSEAVFSAFDQLAQGECTRRSFTPAGGGWTFDYACDAGAGESNGEGTIAGDFSKAYQVKQSVGMAGVTTKGTIAATWEGTCPAGRKEGDFVVSPHIVINVAE